MRKAEFQVPSEVMAEFTDEMVNRDLDNKVTGTNEDNEILVEVIYEKEESKSVDELEKILDNLREQMEEEEDEEEEDEDR